MMTKKVLLSLSVIAAVAAVVVGATTSFFSDEETSAGNVLAAGAIDLGVDNHSYYNGVLNPGTTWRVDYDIDDETPRLFFDFRDLKPGDWGEDTISLHVVNNDAWLCADVTLTADDDNGINEPEDDDGDTDDGPGNGELADAVNFYWWADDGDNVYETCEGSQVEDCVNETLLPAGPMGALNVGQTATVDLADANTNIWGGQGPLTGDEVVFIGKAWCFGNTVFAPYIQDGGNQQNGPDNRPVVCDGTQVNNVTQTDSFMATITFRAVQSRNNLQFECNVPPTPTPSPTETVIPTPTPGVLTVTKLIIGQGTTTSFSFEVNAGGAVPFEADASNDLVVAPGNYTVVESASSGFSTTYTNSLNANADCNVLAVPSAGNVTCNIVNTQILQ